MTTKDEELARCRATFEELATQVGDRGFAGPVVIDAMLQIGLALALAMFRPADVVAELRRVADRVERGEQAGPTFTRH